jgi:hypothetical protein
MENNNEVTTYYNINNTKNINTTYIHTNYKQMQQENHMNGFYNGYLVNSEQGISPRESTYINYNIHQTNNPGVLVYNHHHDNQSVISNTSTNKNQIQCHGNQPNNCYENNNNVIDNYCNKSE